MEEPHQRKRGKGPAQRPSCCAVDPPGVCRGPSREEEGVTEHTGKGVAPWQGLAKRPKGSSFSPFPVGNETDEVQCPGPREGADVPTQPAGPSPVPWDGEPGERAGGVGGSRSAHHQVNRAADLLVFRLLPFHAVPGRRDR